MDISEIIEQLREIDSSRLTPEDRDMLSEAVAELGVWVEILE